MKPPEGPRLHKAEALNPGDKRTYESILKLRRKFEKITFPGSQEAKEKALWGAFARAFFTEARSANVSTRLDETRARKFIWRREQKLNEEEKRFEEYADTDVRAYLKEIIRIETIASDDPHSYDPDSSYGNRGGRAYNERTDRPINIGAPFNYALTYKRTDGKWETISLASFIPDEKAGVLIVDNLQGGDTLKIEREKTEESQARAVYEQEAPELMLFEVLCDLARKTGMKGIALRKASANMWETVRKNALANKKGIYDKVKEAFAMDTSEDTYLPEEYHYLSFKK